MVHVAHDGHHRGTGLEVLLGIGEVLRLQVILGGLVQLLFQGYVEIRADQGRGVEVQLGVDVGHVAQHQQLFEDFARGLANALGKVAHGDGIRGHVGVVNLDGGHHLLGGGLLHPGPAAAAHHVVIVAIEGILHRVALVPGYALRIVLADVILLVGIVIGDALLLHHGRQLRRLGTAHGASTHAGARTAHAGPGTTALGTGGKATLARRGACGIGRTAIGALGICWTAIGALGICRVAIRSLGPGRAGLRGPGRGLGHTLAHHGTRGLLVHGLRHPLANIGLGRLLLPSLDLRGLCRSGFLRLGGFGRRGRLGLGFDFRLGLGLCFGLGFSLGRLWFRLAHRLGLRLGGFGGRLDLRRLFGLGLGRLLYRRGLLGLRLGGGFRLRDGLSLGLVVVRHGKGL